jgi:NAD(P)-dependent dehydrogenase (short-subunit alcohol dehydrogenase family)
MTTQDLEGRTALVVGGAGAIGAACARRLVALGAQVVVADLDPDASTAVADASGAVLGVGVDVTDPASVAAMVERTVADLGSLDVAVNVAGIGGPATRLHEYSDADWNRVIGVNLTGVFTCLRAEIRAMLSQSGSGRSIVNMSSVTGSLGFAGAAAYSTSKHGLEGLTRSAALEYAEDGIRINSVAPGFIETELLVSRRTREELAALAAAHPVKRLGTVDEVADVVAFLASERASFVTGATYATDGGFLAGRTFG